MKKKKNEEKPSRWRIEYLGFGKEENASHLNDFSISEFKSLHLLGNPLLSMNLSAIAIAELEHRFSEDSWSRDNSEAMELSSNDSKLFGFANATRRGILGDVGGKHEERNVRSFSLSFGKVLILSTEMATWIQQKNKRSLFCFFESMKFE